MISMIELKACPFCGSILRIDKYHIQDDFIKEFWGIMCRSCDAYIESEISEKDAIEKWNRRAGDDQ